MMNYDFLASISKWPALNVLVIGDLILDHYIYGSTERTSPEAPVPVVLVDGEQFMAGGAANVARNAVTAGARVACWGATGHDDAGLRLRDLLHDDGIDVSGIISVEDYPTIVKTRIVSQGQQIVRLDKERSLRLHGPALDRLLDNLESRLQSFSAVIISDYLKGFVSDALLSRLMPACQHLCIPVFVDPKGSDYTRYRGASAITPNAREAQAAVGISVTAESDWNTVAEKLRDVVQSRAVIITRGAEGLSLLDENDSFVNVSTSARDVYDVTGAGDTFVCWLALGVAGGLDWHQAATLANVAAGIAVGRSGPATVWPHDVRQALMPGRLGRKLINESDLHALGQQLRAQGKRIVFTNGCFDFLHAGHVAFLQEARALGDVLVLAMNTDESITRLKGAGRPVLGRAQRESLLVAIEAVDYVTVFEGDSPNAVIEVLRPDVLVKGANYSLDQVEGADVITRLGGRVVVVPLTHNIKTSHLIEGRGTSE